jgi:CHASE3 domain sensor protein
MKTTQEDRASGIYPESAKEEWLDGPSSPEVIQNLREMLTRSSAALQHVIADRNRYKAALEVVRDDAFTSRAEMRDHARQALKAPEGRKS